MSEIANEHPTVEVEGVAIDVEVAPLIRLLWDLNIDTINSCQNNHGRVWLEFASALDAEIFLNTVAAYEDDFDALYNRIRGAWSPADQVEDDGWRDQQAWSYEASPIDQSVDEVETAEGEIEEYVTGPADFTFSISVRFPLSDLQSVVDRLRAADGGTDE